VVSFDFSSAQPRLVSLSNILNAGKSVHCYFCPTCTSHIYHHQDVAPENIIVRTLLLEGGNDLDVGGEIFPEGMLSWADDLRNALDPAPVKMAKTNGVNGV
jgi:hypothetical protein